jgi:hypothetical protein
MPQPLRAYAILVGKREASLEDRRDRKEEPNYVDFYTTRFGDERKLVRIVSGSGFRD